MLDLDHITKISLGFFAVSSIQVRVASAGDTASCPDPSSAPAPLDGVIRQVEAMEAIRTEWLPLPSGYFHIMIIYLGVVSDAPR